MKFVWTKKKIAPLTPEEEEDRAYAERRYRRRPPSPTPVVSLDATTLKLTLDQPPDDARAFESLRSSCSGPQELWQRMPVAHWMLGVLHRNWHWIAIAPERQLRLFAWRLVEGLNGSSDPQLAALRRAVFARIEGAATLDELRALQNAHRPLVACAGLKELALCSPGAAGALALWHAATPDVYDAALWAAEFATHHDSFVDIAERVQSWQTATDTTDPQLLATMLARFAHAYPGLRQTAVVEARKRQANLLREVLPDPFWLSPRPAHVWSRDDLLFCRRCGPTRQNSAHLVVADVRFRSCGWCGTPLMELH